MQMGAASISTRPALPIVNSGAGIARDPTACDTTMPNSAQQP